MIESDADELRPLLSVFLLFGFGTAEVQWYIIPEEYGCITIAEFIICLSDKCDVPLEASNPDCPPAGDSQLVVTIP